MSTPRRKLVTLDDAADMYSVSKKTLLRAVEAGDLRLYRMNQRVVRVSEREIDALFGLDPEAA